MRMSVCRLYVLSGLIALGGLVAPTTATAQYRPLAGNGEAVVGEDYHIEAAYSFWDAEPSLLISSESLGIIGSEIDVVNDLGIVSKRLAKLDIVLRPAKKHRFRFQRLPIKYEVDAFPVARDFVFNGQLYRVGFPVTTSVDFSTYRFGYEYDFLYFAKGFLGAGVDLKYTNVDVSLASPIGTEFISAAAPIPTVFFAGRGYLHKNVAVNGEVSFFRMPDNLKETLEGEGSYTDFDFNTTVNFTRYVGAQVGWKKTTVFYDVDLDTGSLKFTGWYFGGVIRY
jgi:hypothetical protein